MTDELEAMPSSEAAQGFILAEMAEAGRVKSIPDHAPFMLVRDGYDIRSIEHLRERPTRATGAVKFRAVKSLADYVNRFGNRKTVAFADTHDHRIRAVINYHSAKDDDGDIYADHCDHTATFIAQRTTSWAAWVGANDKPMKQVGFGRFLEERAPEIIEPDAASLVECAMNLNVTKKLEFKSAVRMSNGFRQFTYIEDDQAKGAVAIPELIKIRLPLFEGMDPEVVPVRVRFRIDEGALALFVTIDNLVEVEKVAFDRCVAALALDCPELMIFDAVL